VFALFVKGFVLFIGVHHKYEKSCFYRVHSGIIEELASALVHILSHYWSSTSSRVAVSSNGRCPFAEDKLLEHGDFSALLEFFLRF